MKITTSNDGLWEGFVYYTDDRFLNIDLHNFHDQKVKQLFSRVNKL